MIALGISINTSYANALPFLITNTYLPLVLREPPPPVLFPNGDFEQGPVIWTEFSTYGYELITQDVSLTPYDGMWVAWLGGVLDEISYIEQQVTVPTNLHYLSYWHAVYSSDSCGNDFERVLVNSSEVLSKDLCFDNNTDGWVQQVIDLSSYAGQSVIIQIRAECNESYNSNLFIDHVGLQFSPNGTNLNHYELTSIDAGSLKTNKPIK